MKTAEDWCDQWNEDNIDVPLDYDTVRKIQADALMEAHGIVMTRSDQSVEPDCACAADDIFSLVQQLRIKK